QPSAPAASTPKRSPKPAPPQPAPPMAAKSPAPLQASSREPSGSRNSQPTWLCRPMPSSPPPTALSKPSRRSPATTGSPTRLTTMRKAPSSSARSRPSSRLSTPTERPKAGIFGSPPLPSTLAAGNAKMSITFVVLRQSGQRYNRAPLSADDSELSLSNENAHDVLDALGIEDPFSSSPWPIAPFRARL